MANISMIDIPKENKKLICMGCDDKEAFFRLTMIEYDGNPEIYCPDCMSEVVRECPEDIELIEVISLLNKSEYQKILEAI